jgi:hypothetical protein
MVLVTPFRLLIRFIYNFTSRNYNHLLHCYIFTQLHANLFILSAVVFACSVCRLNSLQLFFTYELPVTVSYRELLCSQSQSHFTTYSQSVCLSWCRTPSEAHDQIFNSRADGLQDNSSARAPRKTVTPLLRVRLPSRCIAMVTARTHRKTIT